MEDEPVSNHQDTQPDQNPHTEIAPSTTRHGENTSDNKETSCPTVNPTPVGFWRSPNHWVAIFTVVIAGANSLYVYYASQQWRTMDGQFDAMRATIRQNREVLRQSIRQSQSSREGAAAATKAATIADDTLKDSRASFRQEQRAYLTVAAFEMSTPPVVVDKNGRHVCGDIHTANSGRTPALNPAIVRYATFGPNAETSVEALKIPNRPPNGDVLGVTGDKYGSACTLPVDGDAERRLIDGTIPLYIYGAIEYDDIFGQHHETGFCGERVLRSTAFILCSDDRGNGFGNWFEKKKNK